MTVWPAASDPLVLWCPCLSLLVYDPTIPDFTTGLYRDSTLLIFHDWILEARLTSIATSFAPNSSESDHAHIHGHREIILDISS